MVTVPEISLGARPLAAHRLLEAAPFEETSQALSRIFGVRRLRSDNHRAIRTHLNHRKFAGVSFNYLAFEASLEADVGTPCFYAVLVPLTGTFSVSHGADVIASVRNEAACISPLRPMCASFDAECAHLSINIEARVLDEHVAQHLGFATGPLDFSPHIELGSAAGRHLAGVMKLLFRELERAETPEASLSLEELRSTLLSTLIYAQPNNQRDKLLAPVRPCAPDFVTRVQEYVNEYAHEPLSVERLAAIAGVSARGLFGAFRTYCQMTPMAYVRSVRLQRVRGALRSAAPEEGVVSRIAFDWGFSHLGHFSVAYRRAFGETPSETLRRRTESGRVHARR